MIAMPASNVQSVADVHERGDSSGRSSLLVAKQELILPTAPRNSAASHSARCSGISALLYAKSLCRSDKKLPSTSGVDLNPCTTERRQARGASDVVEILCFTGFQQRQPDLAGVAITHHPSDVSSQFHAAILPAITSGCRGQVASDRT